MSSSRKYIIAKAFKKFDKTGDGVVTVDDLRGYDNCPASNEVCFLIDIQQRNDIRALDLSVPHAVTDKCIS